MKLGLVQYSPEFEYPEENILKIEKLISTMKSKADLLIFPEMTLTGYTMNAIKFAEEIDGIGTKYFINLSSRIKTDIFAGIIELDDNKAFNSLVHFDNYGLIKARYRKIHPYSYAGEDKNYGAGEETVITKIDQIKIGLSICYDLRFPELYRLYAKKNAYIMVDIASWPVQRIEHWKTLLKARAIENQCFIVGVNRTGADQYGI
jgi:predicted amidohydrolase